MNKIKKLFLFSAPIIPIFAVVACGNTQSFSNQYLHEKDVLDKYVILNPDDKTFTLDLSKTDLTKIDSNAFTQFKDRVFSQIKNLDAASNKTNSDEKKKQIEQKVYYLSKIIFPASLKEIGPRAFEADTSFLQGKEGQKITELDFSKSTNLEKIDEFAFANNAITNLKLPSSLTFIGQGAFQRNKISSLELSENSKLSIIETGAFFENSLENIDFSNTSTIRQISAGAFENNQIQTITFSQNNTAVTISPSAFKGNSIKSDNEIKNLPTNSKLTNIFN